MICFYCLLPALFQVNLPFYFVYLFIFLFVVQIPLEVRGFELEYIEVDPEVKQETGKANDSGFKYAPVSKTVHNLRAEKITKSYIDPAVTKKQKNLL